MHQFIISHLSAAPVISTLDASQISYIWDNVLVYGVTMLRNTVSNLDNSVHIWDACQNVHPFMHSSIRGQYPDNQKRGFCYFRVKLRTCSEISNKLHLFMPQVTENLHRATFFCCMYATNIKMSSVQNIIVW